jgi:uroporphyrinogen-III synthase
VLITRPAAEAEALAAALARRGFLPVPAPLLRVVPRAVTVPQGVEAVLVSSGNALPALAGVALPLFAVGDATARRAREAGFATVLSAGGDAQDLAALAAARLRPGARLLLAAGAGQGGALAAALRDAGFAVHRRVAYAARPVGRLPAAAVRAIEAGELRAALFLSAETARCFARVLPPALAPRLAAVEALVIGRPAADALTLLPFRRVRVSVAPTLDQVLALL